MGRKAEDHGQYRRLRSVEGRWQEAGSGAVRSQPHTTKCMVIEPRRNAEVRGEQRDLVAPPSPNQLPRQYAFIHGRITAGTEVLTKGSWSKSYRKSNRYHRVELEILLELILYIDALFFQVRVESGQRSGCACSHEF